MKNTNTTMEVNQILEKLSQLELKIDEQNLLQKEVLNFNDACKYLDISASHLYKLTSQKQILFNRLKEAGKMWNPETLQIEDLGTIGNCAGCSVEIYMNRCGNFRNDKNMILCPLCYIKYLVLKGMEMYFTDIEKLKQ